ncbi:MAG: Gfo/Idh/MocA family oxidoreductase [Lentisphaerae bacterium]|nr:Gfo/Idh/MocA family oxidoreductase [Lentisphaerota bacterium]MBT4816676.1 Gfo/Idh/MocA family oxidoreductase [Lentisphaerota bacterium]MBT5605667.1 Gfo/Idh/MocA family oxidoreductase [Lentisphaerota bacterium]MBT7056314.1 Gfo/Idh/MocA family oxidoreductase [Lentisphaerota bacterium]MBT7843647.1 Gfo/Idh/MocA family oxidoreductase [Lentisphaerota bacterium]
MSLELRVGVIGAGSSGCGHMFNLEYFSPGCIKSFCDVTRENFDRIVGATVGGAANAAGDFRADPRQVRPSLRDIPFYTDPEEMIVKEKLNVVTINTFCRDHFDMVKLAVKHNQHILLEKPIAIDADDIEATWELLADYPKVATVNFTMRGAPVTLAARDHIQTHGTIGDIVQVQYVNNVHYGDNYFRGWMRRSENVGDLFLQKATHDFDIINTLIGLTPRRVAAFGSRKVYGGSRPNELTCAECDDKWTCSKSLYRANLDGGRSGSGPKHQSCVFADEIDIDDNQTVIFQYDGGVNVSYSQSFFAPPGGGQRGGYFVGSEGILRLHYYHKFADAGEGHTASGASSIEITQRLEKPRSRKLEVYDWAGASHFDGTRYGFAGKLELIRGGQSDVAGSIREGYVSAKMCLAAQQSIETGQVVDLHFPF